MLQKFLLEVNSAPHTASSLFVPPHPTNVHAFVLAKRYVHKPTLKSLLYARAHWYHCPKLSLTDVHTYTKRRQDAKGFASSFVTSTISIINHSRRHGSLTHHHPPTSTHHNLLTTARLIRTIHLLTANHSLIKIQSSHKLELLNPPLTYPHGHPPTCTHTCMCLHHSRFKFTHIHSWDPVRGRTSPSRWQYCWAAPSITSSISFIHALVYRLLTRLGLVNEPTWLWLFLSNDQNFQYHIISNAQGYAYRIPKSVASRYLQLEKRIAWVISFCPIRSNCYHIRILFRKWTFLPSDCIVQKAAFAKQ